MKQRRTDVFRKLSIHGFDLVKNGHNFSALLEFDITDLRAVLRRGRIAGNGGSLFSFMLKAIGACLRDFPEFNSMISLRKTTVFDTVDVNVPIELEEDGKKINRQLIIRDINSKTITQVDAEIENGRRNPEGAKGFIDSKAAIAILDRLPGFFIKLLFKSAMFSHKRIRDLSGTVFVTSVSMFSTVPGFIIPYAGGPKAVSFAIGSSVKKPVVIKNAIVIREMINITATFNHDSIDGAPAARFINQLRAYIEKDFESLLSS